MIMPTNDDGQAGGAGMGDDGCLILGVPGRSPESKTHERPPSSAGIGIESPSPHIPPSPVGPKFFSSKLAPEFFSLTDRPKIFHYKIEPEFIGLLFGIRIISSIPKLLVEGC